MKNKKGWSRRLGPRSKVVAASPHSPAYRLVIAANILDVRITCRSGQQHVWTTGMRIAT